MIYYVVYISASRGLLKDEDLIDILSQSRTNNEKLRISGILLYHEGNLIQVLEGEEKTVNDLYSKIERDTRHCNVNMVASGFAESRTFSDWAMGFQSVSMHDWKKCAGYFKLSASAIGPALQSGQPEIRTFLKAFLTVNLRFDRSAGGSNLPSLPDSML